MSAPSADPAPTPAPASPVSLPLARGPRPLATRVAREPHDGRWSTAIARVFRPEDVGACDLCPSCTASRETGLCLVIARRYVADADAPLYRFRSGD